MAYSPTTWVEKATQVGPTNLNKIELGLQAAALVADQALAGSTSAGGTAAAAIPQGLVDAKGDLLAASGDNTPARLPVGTVGQVLTVDPAVALGLRWRDRATYATTPPSSPQDGDEWIYPVDTANGIMWRFRYNGQSASSYKWEFVGGAPVLVRVNTNETTASTTPTDLTTVGPQFVAPRAGDYAAAIGCTCSSPTAGFWPVIDGYAGGPLLTACSITIPVANYTAAMMTEGVMAGVAASAAIKMRYYLAFASQSASFSNRWLRVVPVRVS